MPGNHVVEPIGKVSAIRPHAEDDYWGGERSAITLVEGFSDEALLGLASFSHVEVLFLFHEATLTRSSVVRVIRGTIPPGRRSVFLRSGARIGRTGLVRRSAGLKVWWGAR